MGINSKVAAIPSHRLHLHFLYSFSIGMIAISIALAAGMLGYHHYENMSWVDAFANAAMILSGMGPLQPLITTGGKVFAGFYALFSGLFFILIIAVIFSPYIHHFFMKSIMNVQAKNK